MTDREVPPAMTAVGIAFELAQGWEKRAKEAEWYIEVLKKQRDDAVTALREIVAASNDGLAWWMQRRAEIALNRQSLWDHDGGKKP